MTPRRSKKRETARAERIAGTAEFDTEFVADSFSAPPRQVKERWNDARRKPGRPRVGGGAQVISVTVERALLERSDAVARRSGYRVPVSSHVVCGPCLP
ncbi:MAG: hypothetical protein ACJ79C_17980 [Myxococcales bacterium]